MGAFLVEKAAAAIADRTPDATNEEIVIQVEKEIGGKLSERGQSIAIAGYHRRLAESKKTRARAIPKKKQIEEAVVA